MSEAGVGKGESKPLGRLCRVSGGTRPWGLMQGEGGGVGERDLAGQTDRERERERERREREKVNLCLSL